MHDLAIIVVSTNEGRWLTPCLETVLAHVGSVDVDVVLNVIDLDRERHGWDPLDVQGESKDLANRWAKNATIVRQFRPELGSDCSKQGNLAQQAQAGPAQKARTN